MINDAISQMLTCIRNAFQLKHEIVEISYTNVTKRIALLLKQEGVLENVEVYKNKKKYVLILFLKYKDLSRNSALSQIVRVSKSGLRIYCTKNTLPNISNNLGLAILSTSKGIMTHLKAKELNLGGEILFYIL